MKKFLPLQPQNQNVMNIYTKKRMKKWAGDVSNLFIISDQPQGTYTVEIISGLIDGDYFTVGVMTDCDFAERFFDFAELKIFLKIKLI